MAITERPRGTVVSEIPILRPVRIPEPTGVVVTWRCDECGRVASYAAELPTREASFRHARLMAERVCEHAEGCTGGY